MEAELEEAQQIATASNHKYEDAQRKCKVVEGDLERILERAEEFEGKSRDIETQVRELEGMRFFRRIPVVKLKIPGKAFLKSGSRSSVTFKLKFLTLAIY